jgi:hypothetical protein
MIPPVLTHSRVADILRAAIPPAIVLAFVFAMLRFPPTQYGFYPVCPVHGLLGLQCPGCGATRALVALLRGHLTEALRFNALTTLLLPFAFAYGILCYRDFLKRRAIRPLRLPSAAIYSAIAVAAVFTMFRNLPIRFF